MPCNSTEGVNFLFVFSGEGKTATGGVGKMANINCCSIVITSPGSFDRTDEK
jgi:hypothetical protein